MSQNAHWATTALIVLAPSVTRWVVIPLCVILLDVIPLHLAKHNVRSVERGADCLQIPLFARLAQDLRVADDLVAALAQRGQSLHNRIGQRVAETRDPGIAGLVVEAKHGYDRRRFGTRTTQKAAPCSDCENNHNHRRRRQRHYAPIAASLRGVTGWASLRVQIRPVTRNPFDRRNQLIPLLGNRTNVGWLSRIIFQSRSNL